MSDFEQLSLFGDYKKNIVNDSSKSIQPFKIKSSYNRQKESLPNSKRILYNSFTKNYIVKNPKYINTNSNDERQVLCNVIDDLNVNSNIINTIDKFIENGISELDKCNDNVQPIDKYSNDRDLSLLNSWTSFVNIDDITTDERIFNICLLDNVFDQIGSKNACDILKSTYFNNIMRYFTQFSKDISTRNDLLFKEKIRNIEQTLHNNNLTQSGKLRKQFRVKHINTQNDNEIYVTKFIVNSRDGVHISDKRIAAGKKAIICLNDNGFNFEKVKNMISELIWSGYSTSICLNNTTTDNKLIKSLCVSRIDMSNVYENFEFIHKSVNDAYTQAINKLNK